MDATTIRQEIAELIAIVRFMERAPVACKLSKDYAPALTGVRHTLNLKYADLANVLDVEYAD